jgi:parallel beta-helix repeat protein
MAIRTQCRRPSPIYRPEVRGLEDRLLLSTLIVDDDRAQCPEADFTRIQDAVVAASPGDTIAVCPGTYVEQVTIPATKDGLVLRSERPLRAIIQAPPVMTTPGAIVHVDGANDVTIRGFTIRGPFADSSAAGTRSGVLVDNGGSATIRDNYITAIRDVPLSNSQDGFGILVGRVGSPGRATILGNRIDDYQKGGIVVNEAGSDATIERNSIEGAGPTAVTGQNGIQIGFGATARVRRNEVSGNVYTPQTFVAAGILLFDAGATTVERNTVRANDVGIGAFGTAGAVITDNDISGSTFDGIELRDGTTGATVSNNRSDRNGLDGIFVADSSGNAITQNQFKDNGEDGIRLEATATNNTISRNKMKGNGEHDCHDDSVGGGTAGTANSWTKNQGETENRPGLCEGGKSKGGRDKKEKRGQGQAARAS